MTSQKQVATQLPVKKKSKIWSRAMAYKCSFCTEWHSTAMVRDDVILAHTDCKRWTCALSERFSKKSLPFFDKSAPKSYYGIWKEGLEGDCRLSWNISIPRYLALGGVLQISVTGLHLSLLNFGNITHSTPGAQQDIAYSTALNLTPQCCMQWCVHCWIMKHTQHTRCSAG